MLAIFFAKDFFEFFKNTFSFVSYGNRAETVNFPVDELFSSLTVSHVHVNTSVFLHLHLQLFNHLQI